MGDWIAGIGSVQHGQEGKLVFAMRVAETMCFDEYWHDTRFVPKRPNRSGGAEQRCGDNIYHRDRETGHWIQEPGYHSHEDGTPNRDNVQRDTSPPRVLIAREFAYFGAAAVDVPGRFRSWEGSDYFRSVRGHRCNFPDELQNTFIAWLEERSAEAGGLAGDPLDQSDTSPSLCGNPAGAAGNSTMLNPSPPIGREQVVSAASEQSDGSGPSESRQVAMGWNSGAASGS